eukprot:COSAG05_NODE_17888_length_317_cov_1.302752_2_plen_32_part_01
MFHVRTRMRWRFCLAARIPGVVTLRRHRRVRT